MLRKFVQAVVKPQWLLLGVHCCTMLMPVLVEWSSWGAKSSIVMIDGRDYQLHLKRVVFR